MKYLVYGLALLLCALGALPARAEGKPALGDRFSGGVIDKSGDALLTGLIRDVAPQFSQKILQKDSREIKYNIFSPRNPEPGKKYPLVLFMADASTVGDDVRRPLDQGLGALVFATPEAQKQNPCYVLVPQFATVAVDDAYSHTPEVDDLDWLIRSVCETSAVDTQRIYVTGQSMGGMIAMYLNATRPDLFAASLYVDCHWDASACDQLVRHPFIFVYAGDRGKAWPMKEAIENAARKMGVSCTWSEWSARLPLATQDELAATMLAKGQPVNIIGFETGTVLPENGKGSEHMYSFDCAYRLAPLRDWLFRQSLNGQK